MKRASTFIEAALAKRAQAASSEEDLGFGYGVLALDMNSSLALRKRKLLEFGDKLLAVQGSDVFLLAAFIER